MHAAHYWLVGVYKTTMYRTMGETVISRWFDYWVQSCASVDDTWSQGNNQTQCRQWHYIGICTYSHSSIINWSAFLTLALCCCTITSLLSKQKTKSQDAWMLFWSNSVWHFIEYNRRKWTQKLYFQMKEWIARWIQLKAIISNDHL